MYWTDNSYYGIGDIRSANLDGSGSQTLVSELDWPTGIALDLSGGKMYWVDQASGDIRSANVDGSGSQTLVSGLENPWGIAFAGSAVPEPSSLAIMGLGGAILLGYAWCRKGSGEKR